MVAVVTEAVGQCSSAQRGGGSVSFGICRPTLLGPPMPTHSRFHEFASLLTLASLATATVYELAHGDALVAARNFGLLLIALELVRRPAPAGRRRD